MQGRRIAPPPSSWATGECPFEPGDYWRDKIGHWHAVAPNGLLVNLGRHHVDEQPDGSITVVAGPWGSNSILVSNGEAGLSWHGYIVKGQWQSC